MDQLSDASSKECSLVPTFGVIQFPGSCDEYDALDAVERVKGVQGRLLWHADDDIGGVDAIVVPGGFSYGDYLRAGAIARFSPVMEAVTEFARSGGPVLGICNGFQILCEAGLLPGALLPNTSLRFICRDLELTVENVDTIFTKSCSKGEPLSIPIKHASGRYFAPEETYKEISEKGQIVVRYGAGQNPNDSLADIAGVANEAGNVFGLMPHPEHATDLDTGSTDGLKIFESMAEAVV